jgi:hypothetical protein
MEASCSRWSHASTLAWPETSGFESLLKPQQLFSEPAPGFTEVSYELFQLRPIEEEGIGVPVEVAKAQVLRKPLA